MKIKKIIVMAFRKKHIGRPLGERAAIVVSFYPQTMHFSALRSERMINE